MHKSFLKLLEEEKEIIYNIETSKESIVYFLNKYNEGNEEYMKELTSKYEKKVIELEKELLQIRKELKNYIAYLQAL